MNSTIPYIILSWYSAPRRDEDILEFRSVTAIIQNTDTGKYLALEFISNEFWLVWWKVESWETDEEAILREITEESGYSHPKIEGIIFKEAYCRGYKVRKSVDEFVTERVYFVTVSESNNTQIRDEEEWIEKLHWLTQDKMLSSLTLEHHLYYFRSYLNQKNTWQ